jgi:hypothetical protein
MTNALAQLRGVVRIHLEASTEFRQIAARVSSQSTALNAIVAQIREAFRRALGTDIPVIEIDLQSELVN